jgi:hypothetical protein
MISLTLLSLAACDLPDSTPATAAQHRAAMQGAPAGTIIRSPSATSTADVITSDTTGLEKLQRASVVHGN